MKKLRCVVLLIVNILGTLSLAGAQSAFAWASTKVDDQILPSVDPVKVRGNVVTAGSSTVYPLMEALVERYKNEGYSGNVTVDSIGTGAGFERFAKTGETDVASASRGIKPSEIQNAKRLGRSPLEFRIATDALAIVVAKSNTFATDLTTKEIAKLFSTALFWSDVRPSFPKQRIRRYSPGTDSGTFDYFVDHFYANDRTPLLMSPGTQFSEDDNVLVTGVAGSPYAVGFFGYAYYGENSSKLKALAVDGVIPSLDTVNNHTYPVLRPLYVYSDAKIMQTKSQVAAFLAFFLTYVNEEVSRVGYFAAPQAEMDKSKNLWLTTMRDVLPKL